jgi:hypothetical protein
MSVDRVAPVFGDMHLDGWMVFLVNPVRLLYLSTPFFTLRSGRATVR